LSQKKGKLINELHKDNSPVLGQVKHQRQMKIMPSMGKQGQARALAHTEMVVDLDVVVDQTRTKQP
jgi:hypothetical protein